MNRSGGREVLHPPDGTTLLEADISPVASVDAGSDPDSSLGGDPEQRGEDGVSLGWAVGAADVIARVCPTRIHLLMRCGVALFPLLCAVSPSPAYSLCLMGHGRRRQRSFDTATSHPVRHWMHPSSQHWYRSMSPR